MDARPRFFEKAISIEALKPVNCAFDCGSALAEPKVEDGPQSILRVERRVSFANRGGKIADAFVF